MIEVLIIWFITSLFLGAIYAFIMWRAPVEDEEVSIANQNDDDEGATESKAAAHTSGWTF